MITGPQHNAINRYAADNKAGKTGVAPAATTSSHGPGAEESAASGAHQEVSLSREAQMLQKLEQEINSYPNVDSERIANIKNQLASGGYNINSGSVAQKIMLLDSLY